MNRQTRQAPNDTTYQVRLASGKRGRAALTKVQPNNTFRRLKVPRLELPDDALEAVLHLVALRPRRAAELGLAEVERELDVLQGALEPLARLEGLRAPYQSLDVVLVELEDHRAVADGLIEH